MAGHKGAGYSQIVLGLVGFGVTLSALVKVVWIWAQTFLLPDNPRLYSAAMSGLALFLIAWLWSLWTSLTLFRRKDEPPRTSGH